MSTLSALNNVQKQFTDLAASSNKSKSSGGEAFGKTLDLAIKYKGAVLPGAANLAVDTGIAVLEQKGLMPTSSPTNFKDGIEDVFDDLSIGIATSFAAAMSGEDSATAVTPVVDPNSKAAMAITPHAECLAHETPVAAPLISAENVSETKAVLDAVNPYLPKNKVMPIANSSLSLLDELMSDEKDKQKT